MVFSDCKALVQAFQSPTSQDYDPKAKAHLVEIGQWTRDLRHIEAKNNKMADFLSRPSTIGENYVHPESLDIEALEEVSLRTLSPKALADSQALCGEVKSHKIGNMPKSAKMGVEVVDGVELFCEVSGQPRPMIPKNLREVIMQTFHNLGHPKKKETVRRISEFYYWPRMKREIEDFCASCHPCQATAKGNIKPEMGKFPVPDKRFQALHVDVVGPLPESRGYKYILTIFCRNSRHYEAVPMAEATAESCCHAFLHGWVQRYGLPASVCSDNGNSFVARLWQDLQKTLNIKVIFIPYYHQATNGIVERAHGTIKAGLKAMLVDMGDQYKQDWFVHLPWVLLSRRVALQPDLGTSSSKLVLGMDPVVPGQLIGDPNPVMSTEELKGLVSHLEAASDIPAKPTSNHNKEKKTYMPTTTQNATHVYIKKENPKGLLSAYTGPHKIVERPSDSTIRIKVGTFKSGADNLQLHHWSNAKPAFLREDFVEAPMAPRGRPPKPTSPSEGQASTERRQQQQPSDDGETGSAPSNQAPPPPGRRAKINKQPTRRSERIRNQNHATSYSEQNTGSVAAVAANMWSASQQELERINLAINGS